MNIQEFPKDARPREKLLKHGPEVLSDSELLAIILRTGNKKENVLHVANKLLNRFNLKKLSCTSPTILKKSLGIGDAKACQICACFELGRRLSNFKEDEQKTIHQAKDVAELCMPHMQALQKEHFKGIYLNARKKILRTETLSIGSLTESVAQPREIFKIALEENAAAVIIVHNHPSGDPTPSQEDIELTKEIAQSGNILGIPLLDHIIIGDGKYASLREQKHFL